MRNASVRSGTLAVAALLLILRPTAVRAGEVARSFAELQGRVLIGETVTATDQAGQATKGKLVSLTATELTLNTTAGPRTLDGNQLVKVEARRSGPLWNGAVIGAAVGVTPAIIVAADCHDCDGIALFGLIYGAIGAGVGVGIDALWKGNVTVMKLEQPAEKKVSLAPLIARGRKGVLCSVRF